MQHVVLRPGDVVGAQGIGIQPLVHVAVEGKQRLARVVGRELRLPGGVARRVQLGQLVADRHQRRHVLRWQLAQVGNEFGGLRNEGGQGVGQSGRQRTFVIQGFGGREQQQHGHGR